MPLSDLGLSFSPTSDEAGAGLRCYANESVGTPYIKWRSDTGKDWIDNFDISICWYTVSKGMTGTGEYGYGPVSEVIWSKVPAANCTCTTTAGRSGYQWAFPLGSIGRKYLDVGAEYTPFGEQVAPNGWQFSQRINDSIWMQVHIKAWYVSGKTDNNGSNVSARLDNDMLFYTYFTKYTLLSMAVEEGNVVVKYSAVDWHRTDDRWALESFTQDGQELAEWQGYGVSWSFIDDVGLIRFPVSALKRAPDAMSTHIRIHMNAYYRVIGQDFGFVEGTMMLRSDQVCDRPALSVASATENSLVINVSDSHDADREYDRAYVYIEGYGSPVVVEGTSGTATFNLPPLGQIIHVRAYGATDDGATSGTVDLSVAPISGSKVDYVVISPVGSGNPVTCRFNVSEDWSFEPSHTTVKFSGRARDSVGFGVGGSVTGTVKCDIIDDDKYGDLRQSRSDFEALPFAGTCILRGPDGERRLIVVESVGESWDRVRFVKTMNISCREVS